ncbi:MAG: transglutaminase family protein [Henriciella sp.]|uniref:transglutaminase family protein n=1 Tax=Henriciella sp. TaxID=1968823 RepID=UPI0032EBDD00
MLYDIVCTISYKYRTPVWAGRHLLRFTPLELPGVQRAVAANLNVLPAPSERSRFRDFFGNQAHEIVFGNAHSEIGFSLKARVERLQHCLEDEASLALDEMPMALDRIQSLAPDSPLHFVGRSPRIRLSRHLGDYVEDRLPFNVSVLEAVRTLGRALNSEMTFDATATSVETSHEEAFEARHGVCQDFSHIMIAALRSVGIPAGYVSGFLRTKPPEGQPRLSGADAMHAWVRAWCGPDLGWVEYDPTNAVDVGEDHVVVGYGRDYSDVSPVKGVLKAATAQESRQAVDVIPLETAS